MKFNGRPPSPANNSAGENFEPVPYSSQQSTRFSMEQTEQSYILREVRKVIRRVVELELKVEELETLARKNQSRNDEEEKEFIKHWMYQQAKEAFHTWLQAYPNDALRMIMNNRDWFIENGCTKEYDRRLSQLEKEPSDAANINVKPV